MARKQLSEEERQKIKSSLIATRERRQNQSIKIIELKVNCHQTSKETFAKMNNYFKQAKWVVNDMLATSKVNDENHNIFKYEYHAHKSVERLDKNKNTIQETINLPSVLHRGIIQNVKTDIMNLSKAKKKGYKVGALKFRNEVSSIPIITGPWLCIRDNSHITIPGFANLKVYGLKQLSKYKKYELANGQFIRKASGFYIHISICIPKEIKQEQKNYKEVGLDFGIKDNIVTSDGEKLNCSVRESEQLKFLQKQLHRKQQGSKRYWKLRNQIQKEYEHLSNKKTDAANKLIHKLTNNYDIIYFQDEQISKWKKKKHSKKTGKKCGFSFGRQVQASYLGRVKAKLIGLENDKSFKISKWSPTTKFCPNCGALNKIGLNERTYHCKCGYSYDRDIHAAKNVKLFGSTKRAECLEQASAESLASAALDSSDEVSKLVEAKIEDSNL
jgi:putative transposase